MLGGARRAAVSQGFSEDDESLLGKPLSLASELCRACVRLLDLRTKSSLGHCSYEELLET